MVSFRVKVLVIYNMFYPMGSFVSRVEGDSSTLVTVQDKSFSHGPTSILGISFTRCYGFTTYKPLCMLNSAERPNFIGFSFAYVSI